MQLKNFSRIVCLPCKQETIRGFAKVNLLIIDEAALVPDELYRAVRPMLAVSDGRLICLSTPQGKRGFFYKEWAEGGEDWLRISIRADQVPRIKPAFLEEERQDAAVGCPAGRDQPVRSAPAGPGLDAAGDAAALAARNQSRRRLPRRAPTRRGRQRRRCPLGRGRALSLDRFSDAERGDVEPTFGAWLGLRILQLHVCIIYTASGFEKAIGEQWWNGEAIWRAVMGAPLESPIDCTFLTYVPWLSQVLCWMTLLLEGGVVAFVWHPRLRKLWLVGIVGMHVGIAVVLGL